jgi:hypothetical protein
MILLAMASMAIGGGKVQGSAPMVRVFGVQWHNGNSSMTLLALATARQCSNWPTVLNAIHAPSNAM